MAVVVIDTIKPKNQGTFPVVEAKDVKVDNNDKRLDTALGEKASQADVTALQIAVAGKASQADLTALSNTVSGKASKSDLTALSNTVADKADKSALAETNTAVAGKQDALSTSQLAAANSGINSELVTQIGTNTTAIASKADSTTVSALSSTVATKANASDVSSATNNLQAQIDEIVTPVTEEAEVQNARVGADGARYQTLKSRLDTENKDLYIDFNANNTIKDAKVLLNFVDVTGYYSKANTFVEYSNIQRADIDVIPGEVYLLTSRSYYEVARAVFFDSNDDVIGNVWNSNDETECVDTRIHVPVGAAKMGIQKLKTRAATLKRSYGFLNAEKALFNTESVSSAITKINEKLSNYFNDEYEPVELTFTSVSGYYNQYGNFDTSDNISAYELNVTVGEKYLLTSRSYYGMARAAFLDSANNVLSVVWSSNDTAENTNTVVIVPLAAVKMVLQRYSTNVVKLKKDIGSSNVTYNNETLKTNQDYLNFAVSNALKNLYSSVTTTFTATTGYWSRWGSFSEYAGISECDVTVATGERYSLTSKSFYNAARAVFFDDVDNIIGNIWSSNDNALNRNTEFVIPNGAVKMKLQRSGSDIVELKKLSAVRTSNNLTGKNITVIGDSITEYNYRAKTNWAMYIADWTGVTVQNLGVSGTGFAKSNPYINRITNIQANPDMIGVAMSWNDLAAGLPIGEISDTGTDSLCGYVNDFFTALLTAHPTTPIVCYCQSPWGSAHPGITSSDNWFNAVKQICRFKGIPFYGDLYEGGTLKPWIQGNQNEYYVTDNTDLGQTGLTDQVHPNGKGHAYIATYLMNKFAENVVW